MKLKERKKWFITMNRLYKLKRKKEEIETDI